MLFHRRNARQHGIRALQKLAVICCEVWLALGAVYHQRVNGRLRLYRQLHRRGKARAAKAHKARRARCRCKALRIRHLRRHAAFIRRLRAVRHNDNGGHVRAAGHFQHRYLAYRAGNAGVDVCTHKPFRAAHHGAHLHGIALFHRHLTWRANVLAHRQHNFRRQRHHLCGKARRVLPVRHRRALCASRKAPTHLQNPLPSSSRRACPPQGFQIIRIHFSTLFPGASIVPVDEYSFLHRFFPKKAALHGKKWETFTDLPYFVKFLSFSP